MVYIQPESLKTNLQGNELQLAFEFDAKVNCNVRISVCVTEERNDQNVPVMFYTPNKDEYVVNSNFRPGLKQ